MGQACLPSRVLISMHGTFVFLCSFDIIFRDTKALLEAAARVTQCTLEAQAVTFSSE